MCVYNNIYIYMLNAIVLARIEGFGFGFLVLLKKITSINNILETLKIMPLKESISTVMPTGFCLFVLGRGGVHKYVYYKIGKC